MSKPADTQADPVVLKPPIVFTAIRWFFYLATVAIAIGMLAMMNHLTGIPFLYDGPDPRLMGRTVIISYCLLSPTAEYASNDINCNFAYATAAVSLAISLLWSYVQVLRRTPARHPKARFADLALCTLGMLWWAACAVILCIWTDRSNKAGLPQSNWRNGLCVLAWAEFLFFLGLTIMSALLVTNKSQKLFNKYAERKQQKREERQAAKQQKKQAMTEAKHAATEPPRHPANHSPAGPPPSQACEQPPPPPPAPVSVAPPAAATGAWGPQAQHGSAPAGHDIVPAEQRLPVSKGPVDAQNPFLAIEPGASGPQNV